MAAARYHVPLADWERAVDELTQLLADVAHRGCTTTYSEVTPKLRTIRLGPDSYAFHALLGDVSRRAFDEGAPLLSVVVIGKETGRPGNGFIDLARELGFNVPNDWDGEERFWLSQLDQVHRWRRRR